MGSNPIAVVTFFSKPEQSLLFYMFEQQLDAKSKSHNRA